jgi:hypothetical protein
MTHMLFFTYIFFVRAVKKCVPLTYHNVNISDFFSQFRNTDLFLVQEYKLLSKSYQITVLISI